MRTVIVHPQTDIQANQLMKWNQVYPNLQWSIGKCCKKDGKFHLMLEQQRLHHRLGTENSSSIGFSFVELRRWRHCRDRMDSRMSPFPGIRTTRMSVWSNVDRSTDDSGFPTPHNYIGTSLCRWRTAKPSPRHASPSMNRCIVGYAS